MAQTLTQEERTRQVAAIETWLRIFHPLPGEVVELRALRVAGKKAVCHVFGDLSQLARRAAELDAQGAQGCYFTLNPLRTELAGASVSARKDDVIRRHWLPLDCDPIRKTGANSTDEEKAASWAVLDRARGLLGSAGLAGAVVGDSGNGWHLCYPIDMPNDDDAQKVLKALSEGVGQRCNDAQAKIDPMHDAPRIWKLYGTMARKGAEVAEAVNTETGEVVPGRPWRWARLVEGEPWDAATAERNTEALRLLLATWKRIEDLRRGRPTGEEGLSNAERARRYVEKMPPAVSGQGGHNQTYDVAQVLARGFALPRGQSWAILCDYNARCLPPWSEKELLHKIESAEEDSRLPMGYLLDGQPGPKPSTNGWHKTGEHTGRRPNADNSTDTLDADATALDLIEAGTSIRWAWEKWLSPGVLTVLASEPGVGKTRFCADLARRVYHGLPWPDGAAPTFPKESRTLWVPADNQHAELGTLPGAFGFPPDALFLNATRRNPFAGTMLDSPEDLHEFEARIRRVKPAVVFVDTSLNATDRSSHKPEDAKAFFVPLQQIAARQGVVMICVTHLNAAGKPLGRRIMGQARLVIQLESPDPEGQPLRRKLHVIKSNCLYPAPLGITMGDAGNEYDLNPPQSPQGEPGTRSAHDPKAQAAREWLAGQLKGGPRKVGQLRAAAEVEGISVKTLYRAKDQLGVEEYLIDERKWWRLPGEADEDFGPSTVPFPD